MTEQYVTHEVFDDHKAVCGRSFDTMITEVRRLNDNLFKDNGSKSIQSRLNEQEARLDHEEMFHKGVKRFLWFIVTLLLTGFVAFLVRTSAIIAQLEGVTP